MISDDDHEALTLWVGATRYYLGRMTYAVSDFTQMLIKHWPQLPPKTQAIITRDIEEAFAKDAKENNTALYLFHPLGHDCDRREWEKVRALWTPNNQEVTA